MPNLKTYVLFISHAWKYGEEYDRVVQFLDSASYFRWRNCSVPKDDPVHTTGSDRALRKALDEQIRISNVVVIISGMYVSYRDWIDEEIRMAAKYQKPIIGIRPLGSQRVPSAVQQSAKEVVGWRTDSLVSAIRRHAL